MAFAFLALLAAVATGERVYVHVALGLLLADMLVPALFTFPARWWFGLAKWMGFVVSNVLLSAVFLMVLTPTGLVRRILGKDPMRLRAWKAGAESVFEVTDHVYAPSDIANPF